MFIIWNNLNYFVDERDCPPRVCAAGLFQCNNSKCVHSTMLCNNVDNCQDGSGNEFKN